MPKLDGRQFSMMTITDDSGTSAYPPNSSTKQQADPPFTHSQIKPHQTSGLIFYYSSIHSQTANYSQTPLQNTSANSRVKDQRVSRTFTRRMAVRNPPPMRGFPKNTRGLYVQPRSLLTVWRGAKALPLLGVLTPLERLA